jgi:hypothetical protein
MRFLRKPLASEKHTVFVYLNKVPFDFYNTVDIIANSLYAFLYTQEKFE